MKISDKFPRYTEFDPAIPVWCVTPHEGRCLHRFFDTSPLSPSGRYLACLRLPFEDRLPRPCEEAAVVLVDLETATEKIVAQTIGWESQMGANINWGASDDELIFNDVDPKTWQPVAVMLNPHTGRSERFGRGVYHVSPDGQWALSCSLEKMRRTQFGYGVVIPEDLIPVHWELPEDDGLFLTSLQTGECRLLVSLKELIEDHIPDKEKPAIAGHCYYGFHAKWAPTGDRVLFTVRAVAHPWALHFEAQSCSPLLFYIFTMKPDGSQIACATDATFWTRLGHHINFTPDGRALSMNYALDFDHLRFVRCDLDGKNKRRILDGVLGSGHPTIHPDGNHLLTDCYLHEPMTAGDGTVPLRWIDLKTGEEEHIARIRTAQTSLFSALRIDPHPAWDRSWKYVAFNGAPDGTRRVFLADLSSKIDQLEN
jgi:hypothetical protein